MLELLYCGMLLDDEFVTELENDELVVALDETGSEELDTELIELESAAEEFGMELDESVEDELSVLMSSVKDSESLGFSEQLAKRANAAIR